MAEYIEITDFSDERLDIYVRLTGGQLRRGLECDRGIFIAESPTVIGVALDAGCVPLSLLTDKRLLGGDVDEIISRMPEDLPVFFAERELLTEMTGFELTRGALSAMYRPEEKTVEELLLGKSRVAVLEAVADATFRHKKRAEYLERAVYVCPYCGLSEFESKNEKCYCKKCNRTVIYGEDKTISGEGFEFPFKFVNDWYEYQKDFVNALDTREHCLSPLFVDSSDMSEVIVYKNKKDLMKGCEMKLYGDRIAINEGADSEKLFPFDTVTAVSVLGRNKLNVYFENRVYQFKGSKSFNALKYVNIYYRHKNITKGDENGKFLGL